MALDLALRLSDALGEIAQAAEEDLADDDQQRRRHQQQRRQPPVHQREENRRRRELEKGRDHLRQIVADHAGHGRHIRLEAVHHVAGVHLLPAGPAGLHHLGVDAAADDEIHFRRDDRLQPGVITGDQNPQQQESARQDGGQYEIAGQHARCDIHQALAGEDESEIESHAEHAEEHIEPQLPPDTGRVAVEPACVAQDSVHGLSQQADFSPLRSEFLTVR